MSRALLAYKTFQAEPGVSHAGLGIASSAAISVLVRAGIEAAALGVVDGYDLEDKLKSEPNVTHVVLVAPWVDIPFVEGLARRMPHISFTMTTHSDVAFLQSDTFAMRCMVLGATAQQNTRNFTVSGNSMRFCHWFEAAYGVHCQYLPNLYPLPATMPSRSVAKPKASIDIGLFGATRYYKNMLTGAAAALVVSRGDLPVNLWISGGREEGGPAVTGAVREMLNGQSRLTLKVSEWQPWEEFRQTVSQMDLLLQPSFSESFNMVTADGASQGIPSVVSPAICWTPKYWQADPDDALAIARASRSVLHNPHAGIDGFKALAKHNSESLKVWSEYLGHA